MAVVGSAYIVVRAITTGFTKDVEKQFGGVGNIGTKAGSILGKNFSRSFTKIGKIDMSGIADQALAARERFTELIRTGYKVSAVLGTLLPAIGAIVGGLGSLIGALVAASPAAITLGGGLVALGLAAITARLALGGVGEAVSKLNKQSAGGGNQKAADRRIADARQALLDTIRRNAEALREADKVLADAAKNLTGAQLDLNKALAEGQEELQQLNFDSEDAALAEKKAAIELEKARETLLRVQDLPPNSRARKEAELAFAEADLNLRRAKDRNSDLAKEQARLAETGVEGLDGVISAREAAAQAEDRLKEAQIEKGKAVVSAAEAQKRAELELSRAQEDKADGTGGGGDPLAGLTESQKTFAKFISSLKPKIDELKELVAAAFLPDLQKAIDQIVNGPAWNTISSGLEGIADALGEAALSLSDAIIDAENLANLDTVFKTSEFVVKRFGDILASVYGFSLSALAIADPQIRGLFDFLDTKTKGWDEWLKTDEGKAEFQNILTVATGIVGDVSKIIGDTTKAFFNIGLSGAAQPLLDYFKESAAAFKAFSETPAAKELFTSLSENSALILDGVGRWVGALIDLGADPNLGVFFTKLGEAAPIFEDILTEVLKAAPAIGDFIIAFTELVLTFTQGEQITSFFEVLTGAINIVNDVFNSKFVKPILDALGPIIGVFTAIGVIFDVIKFTLLVVAGQILLTMAAFKAAKLIFSTVFNVLRILGGAFLNLARMVIPLVITGLRLLGAAFMANPIGFIIGLIAILVTAFITAYNTSETFRNIVNNALGAVRDFFVAAWETISGALRAVWDWLSANWPLLLAILTGPIGLAVKFIVDNWDSIVDFVKKIPQRIGTALKGVWDGLTSFLKTAWTNTTAFFEGIFKTVRELPGKFGGFLKSLWDGLLSGLKGVWDSVRSFWNNTIGGKGFSIDIPAWVPIFGGKKYDIRIPRLAQGGVAMPVPGGILANIAEGGRPERIEPLDPDGLSKRDKAIISELSGGGGKGMTFNIYPSQGMDEAALAEMISRKIAFMTRKGATA
jgi:phage-related protein